MQKIKITLGFLSLLLLNSCDKSTTSNLQKNNKDHPEHLETQIQTPEWAAQYQAFIPCDKCEKRWMSLQLYSDMTYTLKEVSFLKQKNSHKTSMGKLSFDSENAKIVQLTEAETQKIYYFYLRPDAIEPLDNHKKSLDSADHYQLTKVENIEVNNALKYVDIQANLYKSEKLLLDSVNYIKLSYFFEIDNHSDNVIKLKAKDIVLVDHKYNEYIANFENDPLISIQPKTADYQLISFLYPETSSPAYINIK